MSDDETLADIDLGLLTIQRNLVRIVVLVTSVVVLQGLTLLLLAWIAEGFIVTIVVGVIGGGIFLLGLLVWLVNFRRYGQVALTVETAMEDHPAVTGSDGSDSS